MKDVAIIGAGIGGLTLALELHRVGKTCKVYEAVPSLAPLGVGVNLLPHASKVLANLGLEDALTATSVLTEESAFFNRFGQLIYSEPAGRHAGYAFPQYSVHRGDLQLMLLEAVRERLGPHSVVTDHRATGVRSLSDRILVQIENFAGTEKYPEVEARVAIGCDGIHSALRRQFYPDEAEARYSGIMMWRGVTVHDRFLTGASMVRIGSLATGKVVAYPLKPRLEDAPDKQLINWVAEIEVPEADQSTGEDSRSYLAEVFKDWTFDWLDVPGLIRGADTILRYPMIDRDPVDRWTFDRATLLGDAAHPMVPRGSNGAGQAIIDAHVLAEKLVSEEDPSRALAEYERERLPATNQIVHANRTFPPDLILQETLERTNDQPFNDVTDIFTEEELRSITRRYQDVAGFSLTALEGEE